MEKHWQDVGGVTENEISEALSLITKYCHMTGSSISLFFPMLSRISQLSENHDIVLVLLDQPFFLSSSAHLPERRFIDCSRQCRQDKVHHSFPLKE